MPTAPELRTLVTSAHTRWERLHLRHRDASGEVEAWLRHGELEARRPDGAVVSRRGATPSWTDRDLEPIYESYTWAAMLDPWELARGVDLDDLREDELFGRPVWRARARAREGYDPICSCCPLVFSEVSQRLEYGDDHVGTGFPDGYEIAVDVRTGIVVSDRPAVSGPWPFWGPWFEVEILSSE